MSETILREYGDATRRGVSPDFTAKICSECGFDRYTTAVSALGDVYVAWNACGVSAVRSAGAAARAKLRGEQVEVPCDLRECSPFEQRVLEKAAEISRGHARPYGWVARELGAPDAARAVGNALGRNPVPLLIPCHRVVRTDYSVGGYVFGSAAKRRLLEREGMNLAAIENAARRGFRYVGADGDGTFCLPTCGDIATRLGAPGYVGLHSVEEAHAHGLVPCDLCRPIAA